MCCLGAPCGPRPLSSSCWVTANTAPPKKGLKKPCQVMGFPYFISIGLQLLWPSQQTKQRAFNVPHYQRESCSLLRLLTALWGPVLQGRAPLPLLALYRNEELLQYIGCRPELGYSPWHGSLWISYALMVKHPEEHVLCPAAEHVAFPSSPACTEKIVWGQMQSLIWYCVLSKKTG